MLYRDGRNLDPRIVHQSGRLNGGARRLRVWKDGLVHLVHFRKVVNVGQVYRDGYDVFHFISCRFEHLGDVVECCFGLRANASGGQLARVIRSLLAGNIKRIPGDDSIAEREASLARQIDCLVFLSHAGLAIEHRDK